MGNRATRGLYPLWIGYCEPPRRLDGLGPERSSQALALNLPTRSMNRWDARGRFRRTTGLMPLPKLVGAGAVHPTTGVERI